MSESTAAAPSILDPQVAARGDALRFVMDFIEKSESYRSRYSTVWDELLANYLVTFDSNSSMTYMMNWNRSPMVPPLRDPAFQGRTLGVNRGYFGSRLKDPETNQVIDSLAAQALGLAFGQRDYCQAIPIGLDDPEKARLISRLIMAFLEEPGVYTTNYLGFKDAFIFGTAVMQLGYKRCQRLQMTPQGPQMMTYRDGPLLQPIDIYDFYPDPQGTRIQQDMIGAAKRFRVTKAQAQELMQYGVYDPQTTSRLLSKGTSSIRSVGGGYGQERFPSDDRRVPSETGLLCGFEYWGEVPYQTSDGAQNRVITVLEGEVVRDSINPFFDGLIPFKEIVVNPIAGRFYGLSPAEVIRFMQDSADNLMMAINDGVDNMVNAPLLMGAGFGGDPNRLRQRVPFDIIPCANPEMVKPIEIDHNALVLAAADLERRKQAMREASGATNPLQAISSGDRTTATEISELSRVASQKVELMVQFFERDYLPWLAKGAISRYQQFANPQLIAVLAGDQFAVDLRQINVPADVSFVGSLHATTKGQKVAQFREALTVLSDPDLVMMYPDLVTRYIRDGLDIKDAPIIVQNAVQTLQMRMLMEQVQAVAGGEEEEEAPEKGKPSPPKSKATSPSESASEKGAKA